MLPYTATVIRYSLEVYRESSHIKLRPLNTQNFHEAETAIAIPPINKRLPRYLQRKKRIRTRTRKNKKPANIGFGGLLNISIFLFVM
jgi:hypothetical protein